MQSPRPASRELSRPSFHPHPPPISGTREGPGADPHPPPRGWLQSGATRLRAAAGARGAAGRARPAPPAASPRRPASQPAAAPSRRAHAAQAAAEHVPRRGRSHQRCRSRGAPCGGRAGGRARRLAAAGGGGGGGRAGGSGGGGRGRNTAWLAGASRGCGAPPRPAPAPRSPPAARRGLAGRLCCAPRRPSRLPRPYSPAGGRGGGACLSTAAGTSAAGPCRPFSSPAVATATVIVTPGETRY